MTTLRETVARQLLRFAHSLGSILGEWDDIPPAVQQRLLEQAGYVLRALAEWEPSEAVTDRMWDEYNGSEFGDMGRTLTAALRKMAEEGT